MMLRSQNIRPKRVILTTLFYVIGIFVAKIPKSKINSKFLSVFDIESDDIGLYIFCRKIKNKFIQAMMSLIRLTF